MSPVNGVTIQRHWAARDAVTDPGLHSRSQGSVTGRPISASLADTDYLTPWSRSVPSRKVLTGLVLLWGEGSGGRALIRWPGCLCLLNPVGYPSVGI